MATTISSPGPRTVGMNYQFSIFNFLASRQSGQFSVSRSGILATGILLLAAFLRLYKIADYMTFLGDEGRDVLIVKRLLGGDWVGLGPIASVGGFYLGPIYYYLMAPFLWLFQFNPVGPAVMVALFGVATVFLVYQLGKEFFDERAGFFAATLYAISPLVIAYSRSSWNPNLMPFFSIMMIFTFYRAVVKKSALLFGLTGFFLGITVQLHYLATFLAVIIAVFTLVSNFGEIRSLIKRYVNIALGFLVGFSPFLLFEATHGFPNTITLFKFVVDGTGETGFTGIKFTAIVGNVLFRLFGRLVTKFPPPEQISFESHPDIAVWYWATVALALTSFLLLLFQCSKSLKQRSENWQKYGLLFLWLVVGVSLFGFYKKPIYDYYLGFMFPLPFLLVGNLLSFLWRKKSIQAFSFLILMGLVVLNLSGHPFRFPPNRQLAQVRQISEFVLEKTGGKPFNFALITEQNSDHAYRYFLELLGNSPVAIENPQIDPERKTITEQLLVICEDPRCQPLGHPLWEVAGFGRTEIVGEWNISVVKVFKLVHYREKKS